FKVVDVAIQGLHQTVDEIGHATKPPPLVLESSMSRRSEEMRLTRSARRIVGVTNNQGPLLAGAAVAKRVSSETTVGGPRPFARLTIQSHSYRVTTTEAIQAARRFAGQVAHSGWALTIGYGWRLQSIQPLSPS